MARNVVSHMAFGALLAAACGSSPKPTAAPARTVTRTATTAPARGAPANPCHSPQPIHPKVARVLEADCFGAIEVREKGRVVVWVILAKDADPARVKPAAEAAAGATSHLMDDRKIGGVARLVIPVADAAQVLALSDIDGVAWIEPSGLMDED